MQHEVIETRGVGAVPADPGRGQIPIFVLTLETARDRRAPLLAQLRALGLACRFER